MEGGERQDGAGIHPLMALSLARRMARVRDAPWIAAIVAVAVISGPQGVGAPTCIGPPGSDDHVKKGCEDILLEGVGAARRPWHGGIE